MTNSHALLKSYGHRKATCWVADIHMLCQIWWRGLESRSGQYLFRSFFLQENLFVFSGYQIPRSMMRHNDFSHLCCFLIKQIFQMCKNYIDPSGIRTHATRFDITCGYLQLNRSPSNDHNSSVHHGNWSWLCKIVSYKLDLDPDLENATWRY